MAYAFLARQAATIERQGEGDPMTAVLWLMDIVGSPLSRGMGARAIRSSDRPPPDVRWSPPALHERRTPRRLMNVVRVKQKQNCGREALILVAVVPAPQLTAR